MKQLVKDIEKRERIKQALIDKFAAIAQKTGDPAVADAWKPADEQPFYVCYLYEIGGPYIVGFSSELRAQLFAEEIRNKAITLDVTICDTYPWELMFDDSKKSAKQKSKPKKQ